MCYLCNTWMYSYPFTHSAAAKGSVNTSLRLRGTHGTKSGSLFCEDLVTCGVSSTEATTVDNYMLMRGAHKMRQASPFPFFCVGLPLCMDDHVAGGSFTSV